MMAKMPSLMLGKHLQQLNIRGAIQVANAARICSRSAGRREGSMMWIDIGKMLFLTL
jgi:hypothetical protein